MTPEKLAQLIADLVAALAAEEQITVSGPVPAITVERPRSREHGDWATTIALQLAKSAGMNPRALAELIAERLRTADGIAAADVAGPGFVNITLDAAAAGDLVTTILAADRYVAGQDLAGERINLEYVSANPTGPIHIGGARWAAVGDSLARILSSQGADITREYYFNDAGAQIDRFAASLLAAAQEREAPEDGYGGEYIHDIAARVVADSLAAGEPDPRTLPDEQAQEAFRVRGVELMFDEIKQALHEFRSDFDVFFHEDSVHTSGAVDRAIARLREQGRLFEADGALWLRSSDLGDDKDRVLIRSNGTPTYFAGDVAYYLDKRERGFDRALIMLGADHHGYVGRMMAMCAAFGDTPRQNLEIFIGQLVNLVKDGEPVRMSKRAGTVITLDDLVDAVGVDAARYALTRYATDTAIDLDLDQLSARTMDNPVFYVQYAHARTANVRTNAHAAGVTRDRFDPATLTHPSESTLLGVLAQAPGIVKQAGTLREPHRVARFAEDLASAYHKWYDQCRVTPFGTEEITDTHRSRLALNDATGQVLAELLDLLGVEAPERM